MPHVEEQDLLRRGIRPKLGVDATSRVKASPNDEDCHAQGLLNSWAQGWLRYGPWEWYLGPYGKKNRSRPLIPRQLLSRQPEAFADCPNCRKAYEETELLDEFGYRRKNIDEPFIDKHTRTLTTHHGISTWDITSSKYTRTELAHTLTHMTNTQPNFAIMA